MAKKKDKNDEKGREKGIMDAEIDFNAVKRFFSREWLIILLIFAFSLALHIAFKSTGLFHFDSAYDTIMVERSVNDWSLHYSYGWGTPAMIIIVGFFYYISHLITGTVSAEGAYFFVTFLAAALASAALYMLVRKFAGKFVALGSALLFSVAPLWLTTTTYPKTHSMGIFFSLLSALLILSAAEKEGRKSLVMLFWAGIAAGTSMAIRPIDGGFILIPFAMLYLSPKMTGNGLVLKKERLALKNAAAFIAPAFILLFILFIPKLIETGGVGGWLATLSAETRGGWMGFFSPSLAVSWTYMTKTITYFGWAAAAIGIGYLIKERQLYILSAIAVWFLVFFLYIGNLAVVDARFLLPAVVPLCVLMAYGAAFVYEKSNAAGFACLIALMILLFSAAYPLIEARHEYSGQKEFAEFVAMKTEPNAVVVSGDNYVFLRRYGHRSTFYFGRDNESLRDVTSNLLNGTPVYAVESSFAFTTPYEREMLSKYFIISYVGDAENEIYQFSSLELRRFREKLFKINFNESVIRADAVQNRVI